MPSILRYIGYYANPVRLTLESQYCAIILPKTFDNKRGSDILAKSDYDCAIGFDLCLVFLITFILRIIGSFILSYKYESIPLYNPSIANNSYQPVDDISDDDDDDDDDDDIDIDIIDDDDDDGQPANIPLVKTRQSKEDQTTLNVPTSNMSKRHSRHKQHSSVNHIPINISNIGSINNNNNNYINMDNIDTKDNNKKGLISGIKDFVGNKLNKKNNNDQIHVNITAVDDDDIDDDDDDDDDSDSELVYNAYQQNNNNNRNNNNQSRVKYGNDNNNYSTMVLGTGNDDSDDMLL